MEFDTFSALKKAWKICLFELVAFLLLIWEQVCVALEVFKDIYKWKTLPMMRLLSSKDTKIFENHSNPVMLVFIG